MNITLATKNISETINGFGVIVALHGNNEKWLASFEEDRQHNIILDAPIKVMHIVGESKVLTSSRSKEQITNELVKLLDNVLNMFDNAPIDTKRVLMWEENKMYYSQNEGANIKLAVGDLIVSPNY